MNTRRRRWIVGILATEMVCICICALYLLHETKEPPKLIVGNETPAYSAMAQAKAEDADEPIMLATDLAATPPAEGEETFDPILIQLQQRAQISGEFGVILGFVSTDRAKRKHHHHYPHPSPTPKAEADPALEATGDSLVETLPSSTDADPVTTVSSDALQRGDPLSTAFFAFTPSDVLPPLTDPVMTVANDHLQRGDALSALLPLTNPIITIANKTLQKADALSTLLPPTAPITTAATNVLQKADTLSTLLPSTAPITTAATNVLQKADVLPQILGSPLPATTLPDPNVRAVQTSVIDGVVASQIPATNLIPAANTSSAGRLQSLINNAHSISTSSMPVSNLAGSAAVRAPAQPLASQSLGSMPSATSPSSMLRSIPLTSSLPPTNSPTFGGMNNLTKGALRSAPHGH